MFHLNTQHIYYNQIPIAQIFYVTLCKGMGVEIGKGCPGHSFQQYFCHAIDDKLWLMQNNITTHKILT